MPGPAAETGAAGRRNVTRMLVSLLRRARNMGASIRLAWVNGRPGAVLYDADLPQGTMRFAEFFQVADGRIQSIKLLYDATQYVALGGR